MLSRDQQQLLGSLGAGMAADALIDRLRDRGTLEGGRSAPQNGCWINYNRKAVWLEDHESPRVSWRLGYLEPAPVGTGVST